MKRNLRKLLSAVCCLAMLMTMLPITASAADEVFFQDDFSKYTVGAFDAAANGYKYTKASGTPDVTIEAEGGNQYLKIAAQRPWMEMGSPTGTYTMQFDVRRDKASSGLMELWMGTQPNGQTIRMRLHENGAVAFLDTATSKNYFLLNDGGFSNGGYNDNRKDEANAILAANTWYHVEFIADAGANTIKLTVSEVGGTASYQAERTMPDFDNHTLRIDGQDFSGSTIAVSLDNIKVVSGAVEATLEQEGYTGDLHCLECGEVIEKGTVLPKLMELPVTGDASDPALWLMMLLLSGGALLLLRRSKALAQH